MYIHLALLIPLIILAVLGGASLWNVLREIYGILRDVRRRYE